MKVSKNFEQVLDVDFIIDLVRFTQRMGREVSTSDEEQNDLGDSNPAPTPPPATTSQGGESGLFCCPGTPLD